MARYQSNGYINSLYQTQYITVGDVKMTVKEFKAMQKANAKKEKDFQKSNKHYHIAIRNQNNDAKR